MVYVGAALNPCKTEYYDLPGLNAEMTQSHSMTSILLPEIAH